MKAYKIPYNSLNIHSELIRDYQDKNMNLFPLINSFPDTDSLTNLANIKSKEFSDINRGKLIEFLKKQYSEINTSENVQRNLNLLSKNNSVTITTGHQLSLMTGPLYFIYKIVSVLKLSILMNKRKTGINYIPVFWMASEDHDF